MPLVIYGTWAAVLYRMIEIRVHDEYDTTRALIFYATYQTTTSGPPYSPFSQKAVFQPKLFKEKVSVNQLKSLSQYKDNG